MENEQPDKGTDSKLSKCHVNTARVSCRMQHRLKVLCGCRCTSGEVCMNLHINRASFSSSALYKLASSFLPSPHITSFMTPGQRDARLPPRVARRHGLSHITHDAFLFRRRGLREGGGCSPRGSLRATGDTSESRPTSSEDRPSDASAVEHVLQPRHVCVCFSGP